MCTSKDQNLDQISNSWNRSTSGHMVYVYYDTTDSISYTTLFTYWSSVSLYTPFNTHVRKYVKYSAKLSILWYKILRHSIITANMKWITWFDNKYELSNLLRLKLFMYKKYKNIPFFKNHKIIQTIHTKYNNDPIKYSKLLQRSISFLQNAPLIFLTSVRC